MLGGVLLCLGIGICEGFTLYVLSKLAERYRRQSYSQLVRATLGRKLSAFVAAVLVVLTFGEVVTLGVWQQSSSFLLLVSGVAATVG